MTTVGLLPLAGRGDLPGPVLRGEPLFAHALAALAGVVDEIVVSGPAVRTGRLLRAAPRLGVPLREAGPGWVWPGEGVLLVHDPLCPLTPVSLLADLRRRVATGPVRAAVAFRPVTDTVKTVLDDRIEGTVDREGLVAVTSPLVVRGEGVSVGPWPDGDLAKLVGWLRGRGEEVALVEGPSLGRRVEDASAVALLECLDEVGRKTPAG